MAAFLTGALVGKYLIHGFFLNGVLMLKIFSKCQGSWIVMFFTTILFVYCWSVAYNQVLKIYPEYLPYLIDNNMHIKFRTFMKGVATLSWFGHFTLAWMVTDIMLQVS